LSQPDNLLTAWRNGLIDCDMRLSQARLAQCHGVRVPTYERQQITPGILHLGVGAFHRAHQAVYADDLLAGGDMRWGIVGVSLRSDRAQRQLQPQDHLYTVATKSTEQTDYRVIGSVLEVLVLAQQRAQLMAYFADPRIQVVTLTITEKGYCLGSDGGINWSHPDVQHDLAHPESARGAPGLLVAGLRARRAAGAGPLTVISCDNLQANGQATQRVVAEMFAAVDPEGLRWMQDHVSFPGTMVDRIVPATRAGDLTRLADRQGYEDAGLVTAEPFTQWVIESDFAGIQPDWQSVGAQWVDTVAPYESAKLRLLNASHSALAYWGLHRGYTFIHQAVADPELLARTINFMADEVIPNLALPTEFDVSAYQAAIVDRFRNNAVPYPARQVAADGSLKLAQRVFPTLQNNQETGRASPWALDVVAAWLAALLDPLIEFDDPARDQLPVDLNPEMSSADLVNRLVHSTTLCGPVAKNTSSMQALITRLGAYRGL